MLKRTKGYILLALLVITGMANGVGTNTLNHRERKTLVTHLKESRAEYLKSIKGLSAQQRAFKPTADQWSVDDYMHHMAMAEEGLWNIVARTLRQAPASQNRLAVNHTDTELLNLVHHDARTAATLEAYLPTNSPYPNTYTALVQFKKSRSKAIKYITTTTEDVRSHVAPLPFGAADAYQVVLLISAHTALHTAAIHRLKAHPSFPEK